jgi:hypothetical protein
MTVSTLTPTAGLIAVKGSTRNGVRTTVSVTRGWADYVVSIECKSVYGISTDGWSCTSIEEAYEKAAYVYDNRGQWESAVVE